MPSTPRTGFLARSCRDLLQTAWDAAKGLEAFHRTVMFKGPVMLIAVAGVIASAWDLAVHLMPAGRPQNAVCADLFLLAVCFAYLRFRRFRSFLWCFFLSATVWNACISGAMVFLTGHAYKPVTALQNVLECVICGLPPLVVAAWIESASRRKAQAAFR